MITSDSTILFDEGMALLTREHEDYEFQKILANLYSMLLAVPKIKVWKYLPLIYKLTKLELAHANCCGLIEDEEDMEIEE